MITEFLTPDPKSFLEMVLAVSLLIILVLFTRKAIARYQQANDLVADGFPGEEVLTRIGVYPGPSRE